MRWLQFFGALVFFLTSGLAPLRGQQVAFENWRQEQGLPVSGINHIFYDSRHYIWLATEGGGLVQFDGRNFKAFGPQSGLPALYLNQIFESPDGALWLAASNGLFRFDGRIFEKILADETAFCLCDGNAGALFIGTANGLYAIKPQQAPQLLVKTWGEVTSCTQLNPTQWAFGTAAGLMVWRPQTPLKEARNLLPDEEVKSLAVAQNHLYIGTKAGLFVMDTASQKTQAVAIKNRSGAPVNFEDVRALSVSNTGTVWAGSYTAGLVALDAQGKQLDFFGLQEGLPKGKVRSLGLDATGTVWLGTLDGFSRLVNPNIVQFNNGPGLPDGPVIAVHQTPDGEIWYGTAAGLAVWPPQNTESFDFPQGLVFAIRQQGASSDLWMGTESGLIRSRNGKLDHITQRLADSVNFVLDVLPGPRETYVAAASGLYVFDGENLAPHPAAALQNVPIAALLAVQQELWVATIGNGVWRVSKNGTAQQIPESKSWNTTALAKVGPLVLMGSNGNGLRIFDGQHIRQLTAADGLISDNVWALAPDTSGGIWLGTERGLQYLKVMAQGLVRIQQKITLNNGLLNQEVGRNALHFNPSNNTLTVGTNSGFAVIDLNRHAASAKAIHLHINGMRLFFKPPDSTQISAPFTELPEERVFDHNQNYFSFQFSGIAPAHLEVVYRYILRGQDQRFTTAGANMEAVFTNIPPGKYSFEVQAVVADQVLGTAVLPFQIRPAFWETIWFWALLLGLLGLMVYAWVRQRIKNLNERLALEAEKADWERKALRLQMNPHFIFNALDGITAFIFKNEPQKAVRYLSNFAKLMRLTLESSRESYIPLETEINILKNYLELEQLRFSSQFDYEIHCEEDLDVYTEIPPMMIQPHVENAILHGLRPLEGRKGKVEITFERQGNDAVRVSITDNGIGRTQAAAIKAKSGTQHTSLAGTITENRMALMRKTGGGSYNMEIIDLTTDGQATGTQVVLILPGVFDDNND